VSSNDTTTDRRRLHALVTEHLWIAAVAAKLPASVTPAHLANAPQDQQDRFQAACETMLKLAPTFNPERASFTTYVWRSVHRDARRERLHLVSGGRGTVAALEDAGQAAYHADQAPRKPYQPDPIASAMDTALGAGRRDAIRAVISLDDAVGEGENGEPLTLHDVTMDPHTLDPAALVAIADERRCRVLDLIHPNPPREDTTMPTANTHSRRPLLPWTELLDGQEHVLVAAEHDKNVDNMAQWVRTRAHSRGLSATVHIDRTAGTVTLQARPKPEQVAA
jgi:hypothetical protein